MSYGGEIKYSYVKVKIVKAEKPTFWYKHLVGQIVEVQKRETENHISYRYDWTNSKEAKDLDIYDVIEV